MMAKKVNKLFVLKQITLLYNHFNRKGYTQKSFARIIGVTQPQLSRILKGKSNLTECHALYLQSKLGVNIKWLHTGKGRMFANEKLIDPLDSRVGKILKNYSKLDDDYREMLSILSETLMVHQKNGVATTDLASLKNDARQGLI